MNRETKKAWLVLQDGTAFEGTRFGAEGDALGELVFTTNMCGYLETLTDPSYWGQIVMQTFPLIGNYGVIEADFEGECCVRGYVVRHWCPTPSNFRCQYDLDAFLKEKGVPGICGIDTREVTRIIREKGVTNAVITSTPPADLRPLEEYRVENAVKAVTRTVSVTLPAQGEERHHVALMDYGAKANIARELQKRGCRVTILPADTSAEEILALGAEMHQRVSRFVTRMEDINTKLQATRKSYDDAMTSLTGNVGIIKSAVKLEEMQIKHARSLAGALNDTAPLLTQENNTQKPENL